jgi:hypothetical protein
MDIAKVRAALDGPVARGESRMRTALKLAQSRVMDRDNHAAMTDALSRLYGAAAQSIDDILSNLTASERARLAVFCYGRAHLNAIGLRIAAQCERDQLIAASQSATAGHALFSQSRADLRSERPARRAAITLASVGSRRGSDAAAAELSA